MNANPPEPPSFWEDANDEEVLEPERTLPDVIIDLLDRLAKAKSDAQRISASKQKRRDAVIDDALKHLLAGIDHDFEPQEEKATALVADLTDEIKLATLQHGGTVKGDELQAVYSSGRVTWDNKGLGGYAVAHPEVLRFQKTGKAYVSITKA